MFSLYLKIRILKLLRLAGFIFCRGMIGGTALRYQEGEYLKKTIPIKITLQRKKKEVKTKEIMLSAKT